MTRRVSRERRDERVKGHDAIGKQNERKRKKKVETRERERERVAADLHRWRLESAEKFSSSNGRHRRPRE